MIHLTKHEQAEFARCAQAMYARGRNAEGDNLSGCAAYNDAPITTERYDRAASVYRAWLVFDEPNVNICAVGCSKCKMVAQRS